MTTRASSSSVARPGLVEALDVALAVDELEESTGTTSAPISKRPSGSRSSRAARAPTGACGGCTWGRRSGSFRGRRGRAPSRRLALGPQALRHGLAAVRTVALDLGRKQLLQPAHIDAPRACGRRVHHRRVCRRTAVNARFQLRRPVRVRSPEPGGCRSPRHRRSGDARRAVAPSRMPKPTPIGRHGCADQRNLARHFVQVQMAAPVTPFSET